MREVTATTETAGFEYEVTYRAFESVEEILQTVDGGEEAVLAIVNSAQRQNALQGGKSVVLTAIKALPEGEAPSLENEALATAIQKHRETALAYTIGKPRGATGGLTQKDKAALGTKVAEYTISNGKPPSQREMQEIMAELGLTDKING
jgi:hypothetical protein